MANALKTLFGDIAAAIKEKTGDTATMKPAEFPAKIAAIPTGGGGSAAGAVTVTFCNYDGTELYSRQVFIGDDCPDPVTQGKMPTPTRESSVQYDYTHNGWSTTKGGSASTSALKSITADRSVYAAYSSTARMYTARFYDGDTLMKTEQVAYGAQATPPDTTKDGYAFVSWAPSDLTIRGNTDFYGEWISDEGWLVKIDFPINLGNSGKNAQAIYSVDGTKFFIACNTTLYMYDATSHPYSRIGTATLSGNPNQMAVSPNGKLLAVTCNKYSNLAKDHVHLYYLSDDTLTRVNLDPNYAYTSSAFGTSVEFSTDSRKLFAICGSSVIMTEINTEIDSSNLSENRSCKTVTLGNMGTAGRMQLACSPNGQKLAVGSDATFGNNTIGVYIYNFVDGNVVFEDRSQNIDTGIARPNRLAYSHDGRYLAVACLPNTSSEDNYEMIVYDTTTVPYTRVLGKNLTSGYASDVRFSHDDSLVAFTTSESPYLEVYDVGTWTRRDDPKEIPTTYCSSVSFSPDDTVLAVTTQTTEHVILYDVRK